MYTLVSGYLPFQGGNAAEVFRKIKECEFHFNHREFDDVSPECKELISKLLVVKEKKRISGQEALKHPWFKIFAGDAPVQGKELKISNEVLGRLRSFKGVTTFQKAALNLLVKTATEKEV